MKVDELINEVFEVDKNAHVKNVKKNIEALENLVIKNRDTLKPIEKNVVGIKNSFSEILASMLAAQEQEKQEILAKENEEKKKKDLFSKNRAGIGTTIPIERKSQV